MSPFRYTSSVGRIPGRYASHKLDVSAIPGPSDANAVLENVVQKRDGSWHEITGTLRSSGTAPCHSPRAVAAAFDAAGKAIEVADIPAQTQAADLAPGGSAPFRLLFELPASAADVKTWASCGG